MSYNIVMIERTTFLDARSNPVDGYRVTYTTESNVTDWIELPRGAYNPAAVKSAIEAQVKLTEAVLKP